MNKNILLVLSIIKGRNFPRSDDQLLIEAKFDNLVMRTDPIQSETEPEFNCELAWMMERRRLPSHRMYKSPVKLECLKVDKNKHQENIGYIILDIRSLQHENESPKNHSWHKLLGTRRYSDKFFPELFLNLSLEESQEIPNEVVETTGTVVKDATVDILEPVLRAEHAYFQIGPDDSGNNIFNLVIIVVFGKYLDSLISEEHIHTTTGDFYFSFTLLGSHIETVRFQDISKADFLADKTAARIFTSFKLLKEYLKQQSTVSISFHSGDTCLGTSALSLKKIYDSSNSEISSLPMKFDKILELTSHNVPNISALVGVQVELSVEQPSKSIQTPTVLHTPPERLAKPAPTSNESAKSAYSNDVIVQESNKKTSGEQISIDAPSHTKQNSNGPEDCQNQQPKHFIVEEPEPHIKISTAAENAVQNQVHIPKTLPVVYQEPSPVRPVLPSANSAFATAGGDASTRLHRYCLVVDLQKLAVTHLDKQRQCILRYNYPVFGKSSTISTHPPIYITKDMSVSIPHGLCEFNFASLTQQLVTVFQIYPLQVSIVDIDKLEEFATASINMSTLLQTEKYDNFNNGCTEQKFSTTVKLESLSASGEIYVVLTLCDYGATNMSPRMLQGKDFKSVGDDVLYNAMRELDHWKEQQKMIYGKKLQDMEKEHLQTLANEWKQRDIERETSYQQKMIQLRNLEEKLAHRMDDLNNREKSLTLRDVELSRTKDDMQHNYERIVREAKDVARRLMETHQHELALEKNQTHAARDETARLASELTKVKEQMQDYIDELDMLRKERMKAPSASMEFQVHLLQKEKDELEKQLAEQKKVKANYKQMWQKTLKEFHCYKEQIQRERQEHLEQEEEKLEQRKKEYIREKIPHSQPKLLHQDKYHNYHEPVDGALDKSTDHHSAQKQNPTDDLEEKLGQLIEERETLMKTKLYDSSDAVIVQINERISELLSQHP